MKWLIQYYCDKMLSYLALPLIDFRFKITWSVAISVPSVDLHRYTRFDSCRLTASPNILYGLKLSQVVIVTITTSTNLF